MKKFSTAIIAIVVALSAVLGLYACSDKLPETNYEKVCFAFNGVEKSFKDSGKKGAAELNKVYASENADAALETIYSLYTSDDKRGNSAEDLDYNQPPMIQFQYLKKVLEKIGENFSFGTKYCDTITGKVNIDIETGQKATGADSEFDYNFLLSIAIQIDDNDLITADVSFDIDLRRGSENYATKWFVEMLLDYDMKNASPNYTLAMFTENDEKDLPYYDHFTYEYDYVEVNNSSVKEWRKFCMESAERLVKDGAHPSFDEYIEEGLIYKVDRCQWFKNNGLYKFNDVSGSKEQTIAKALFDGIGLNAESIGGDRFFEKTGTQNNAITDIYGDFSRIYGEDIIYDLIVKESGGNGGNDGEYFAIRAMNSELNGGVEWEHANDISFYELVTEFYDAIDNHRVDPELWFVNGSQGLITTVGDPFSLEYYFTVFKDGGNNSAYTPVPVSLEASISEAYYALSKLRGVPTDQLGNACKVIFKKPMSNVEGSMPFFYCGEKPQGPVDQSELSSIFPKELKLLGVPEYVGENVKFNFTAGDGRDHLSVHDSDQIEAKDYIAALYTNGFYYADVAEFREGVETVRKEMSDFWLYITFDHSEKKDFFLLDIWKESFESEPEQGGNDGEQEQDPEPDPEPEIIEEFVDYISLVGNFNGWETEIGCYEFEPFPNGFVLSDIQLSSGEKFKIVKNHSFDNGGYGYKHIQNIRNYEKIFEPKDAEDNIFVKTDCVFTIIAEINDGNITFFIAEVRNA